jgi:hypothetical protein
VWHILQHSLMQNPLHNLSTKTLFSLTLFLTNSASLLWSGFLHHSKKMYSCQLWYCVVRQAFQINVSSEIPCSTVSAFTNCTLKVQSCVLVWSVCHGNQHTDTQSSFEQFHAPFIYFLSVLNKSEGVHLSDWCPLQYVC